jgi:hypothetical protein
MTTFQYNDAGQPRSLKSGYCGVRALVIATGMAWADAEKHLKTFTKNGKAGSGALSKGICKADYDAALKALGFVWRAAPKFTGRKARCADLTNKVIARQSKHFTAVIDGTPHDIFDCSNKMVYGFWEQMT